MNRVYILLLTLFFLLAGCAAPFPEEPAPQEELFVFTRDNFPTLDGSTSMIPLGEAIASVLLGESREEVADLIDFHRTTESFRYLIQGESDLLLVAEPNAQAVEEMGKFAYEMKPIAKEALVFIVNSDNPIDSLTVEQLRGIYTGQITNWNQVGGDDVEIIAFQRNATSGSQVLMDKLVMDGQAMMDAPSEWIPGDMGGLMDGVRGYEDSAAAIGYSVYYYANDMRMAEGMKIIRVNGVEPTNETIFDSSYPLTNPYFAVISAGTPEDSPTRILFDWLQSADGQLVLERQGYVPVVQEEEGCAQETAPEPETAFTPTSGVRMDLSKLTPFEPPEEIYTRRTEEWVDELIPGDYGLLRPYVGARSPFDRTYFGEKAVYNGPMGLIDETGAIVVDPVYVNAEPIYETYVNRDLPLYLLVKATTVEHERYGTIPDLLYGFCSFDGSVSIPCQYAGITASNGYLLALLDEETGIFHIYDTDGNLLLDSADWETRPVLPSAYDTSIGTVSDHLISLIVEVEDVGFQTLLYDWNGNLLSDPYAYIDLRFEPPFVYRTHDDTFGFLDQYGTPLMEFEGRAWSGFRQGQLLVDLPTGRAVMDPAGNVLWTPPEDTGLVFSIISETTVYYSDGPGAAGSVCVDRDFEPMYPDAERVMHLTGDCFLLQQDGGCYVTDGTRTVPLPGKTVIPDDPNTHIYGSGRDGGLLLIDWQEGETAQTYLFDAELNLLGQYPQSCYLKIDRISGDGAVALNFAQYPQGSPLDYNGVPTLPNISLLDVYSGWYLVEDDFSCGYMDADGNWLFRVSLMADMTD